MLVFTWFDGVEALEGCLLELDGPDWGLAVGV